MRTYGHERIHGEYREIRISHIQIESTQERRQINQMASPNTCILHFWVYTVLFILLSSVCASHTNAASSTQYMYTVTSTIETEMDYTWPSWTISAVATLTDDIGSDEVDLPFSFPFYAPYRKIWVLSNGALSLNGPDVSCCTPDGCYFIDPPQHCTVNSTSFANLIMPCMTDLDPSLSEEAQIYFRTAHDRLDVRYEHISAWSQSPLEFSYSFALTLKSSGEIEFRYYNVTDPTHTTWFTPLNENPVEPKSYREWIVGIRGVTMSDRDRRVHEILQAASSATAPANPSASPEEIARSQYAIEMTEWETDHAGAYPGRSEVQNNRTIAFCPLATEFCMQPINGPSSVQNTVYITAPDLTCASVSKHQFACRLRPSSAVATLDPFQPIPPENSTVQVDAVYIDELQSFACVLPTLATLMSQLIPPPPNNADGSRQKLFQVALVDLSASNRQPELFMEEKLWFEYVDGTSSPSTPVVPSSPIPTTPSSIYAVTQSLCGRCASIHPRFCRQDCSGSYRGNATLDSCGQCFGGTTGLRPGRSRSCAGICFDPSMKHDPGNQTSTECFCRGVYQRQLTDAKVIDRFAGSTAVSTQAYYDPSGQEVRFTMATLPSTDDPAQADSDSIPTSYLTSTKAAASPREPVESDGNGAADVSDPPPPAPTGSNEGVFSDTELPSIHSSDAAVFRASDLPSPVPALCSFESRDDLTRTFDVPLDIYEFSLVGCTIIGLVIMLAKRECDKRPASGARRRDRDHFLPVAQGAPGAIPVLHLPAAGQGGVAVVEMNDGLGVAPSPPPSLPPSPRAHRSSALVGGGYQTSQRASIQAASSSSSRGSAGSANSRGGQIPGSSPTGTLGRTSDPGSTNVLPLAGIHSAIPSVHGSPSAVGSSSSPVDNGSSPVPRTSSPRPNRSAASTSTTNRPASSSARRANYTSTHGHSASGSTRRANDPSGASSPNGSASGSARRMNDPPTSSRSVGGSGRRPNDSVSSMHPQLSETTMLVHRSPSPALAMVPAFSDGNVGVMSSRSSKADRRLRRERRKAKLASMRDLSPGRRGAMDRVAGDEDGEAPAAITAILEEHRRANASYGRVAQLAEQSSSPPIKTNTPPPSKPSLSRGGSKSKLKLATSPSTVPFALSSSLPTDVPVSPFSTNYWPQYDTSQDFGFKYVRGGDSGSSSIASSSIPTASSLPSHIPVNPFQFDLRGGFDAGQDTTAKKKQPTLTPIVVSNQPAFTLPPNPVFALQPLPVASSAGVDTGNANLEVKDN